MYESFKLACVDAVKFSRETKEDYWVCKHENKFRISATWKRSWLFHVYPGGRKIVSAEGKQYWEGGNL